MRDNTRNVFDPREPLLVIPSPIVTMTQADADMAVKSSPIIFMPEYVNIAAVAVFTNAEMINEKHCLVIVTHHVQSKRTGKKRVMGSWKITAGIGPTGEKHIFSLKWPEPQTADTDGNSPVPAEPAMAT